MTKRSKLELALKGVPDYIQAAIEAGENDHAEAKVKGVIEYQKKAAEQKQARATALQDARRWVLEELPGLIRKETSEGRRRLEIDTLEDENADKDFRPWARVKACEEIHLDVEQERYEASHDIDWPRGPGTRYILVW